MARASPRRRQRGERARLVREQRRVRAAERPSSGGRHGLGVRHAGTLASGETARWDRPGHSMCGLSEEHTSELQSRSDLVCRLLLEKKNTLATLITLTHIIYIV